MPRAGATLTPALHRCPVRLLKGDRPVDRLVALRNREGAARYRDRERLWVHAGPVLVWTTSDLPADGWGRRDTYGQIQHATAEVVGVAEILVRGPRSWHWILARRLVAAAVFARIGHGAVDCHVCDCWLVAKATAVAGNRDARMVPIERDSGTRMPSDCREGVPRHEGSSHHSDAKKD